MNNHSFEIKKLLKIIKLNNSILLNWLSVGLPIFLSAFYFSPSLLFLKWVYAIFFLLPTVFILKNNGLYLSKILSAFIILILIYAILVFISTFWSDSPRIFDLFYNTVFFSAFFLGTAFLGLHGRINTNFICKSIIITGAITGTLICLYYYSNEHWTNRLSLSGWLRMGPTNSNHIAVNYSISSLLAIVFLTYQNKTKFILLYLLLSGLNLIPLFASQCRGALLSFFTVVFIYLLLGKFAKRLKIFMSVIIFFLLLTLIFILIIHPDSFISQRINNDGFRKEIWADSVMHTVQNNFWLGEGRGGNKIPVELPTEKRFHTFYHAHNQFIDAFYFTGLIGFCIFLLINIYTFIGFSTSPAIFPFYIWFLNGLFCSLTNGSARTFFGFWWIGFWIPIALIGGLLLQERAFNTSRKLGFFTEFFGWLEGAMRKRRDGDTRSNSL